MFGPEAVDRAVLCQDLSHHPDLPPDELGVAVVRHRRHVPVVLHVEIVADLDPPLVGRVRELPEHVALAALPARGRDGVRCELAWPEREAALVVGGDDDLTHAERGRCGHPVLGVQVGRVEDVGVEAGIVTLSLAGVVDAGGVAVVVRRVGPCRNTKG